MPQTRTNWIILTIVTALVGLVWINATRALPAVTDTAGRPAAAQLGSLAPDITLTTLSEGPLTLSDYRGKPVVLLFWTTWCSICRAEMPGVEAAYRDLGNQAQVIGVNVGEGSFLAQNYVAEMGMSFPVISDGDMIMASAYNIRAFPTTYFIDERGVIVDIHVGSLGEASLRRWMIETGG